MLMTDTQLTPTERTQLKRHRERGAFDRRTIYEIIDATPTCHVAFLLHGKPAVVPTLHWREGDRVYWHASTGSQAARCASGNDVCLNVSILDGLVLARSAFHHSANYRSVTIFGKAVPISDFEKKRERLKTFLEGLYPGRWNQLRPITDKEIRATLLLSLPIDEASAKIRVGQPVDDEEDYDTPVWAGVIPIARQFLEPIPDSKSLSDVDIPPYVKDLVQNSGI